MGFASAALIKGSGDRLSGPVFDLFGPEPDQLFKPGAGASAGFKGIGGMQWATALYPNATLVGNEPPPYL